MPVLPAARPPSLDSQDSPWVVLKFGGTSVSSRDRWHTVAQLTSERSQDEFARVLVVVSALGGVTNDLQRIADGAGTTSLVVDSLIERHFALAEELGLDGRALLGEQFESIRAATGPRQERTLAWQAGLLAQGELLSSMLGAAFLRAQGLDISWCDARLWLQARARPNQNTWAQRLSAACEMVSDEAWRNGFNAQPTRSLITQGFIARHADGGTVVLGRGGSDTSAACFGALLRARRVEIWTDVPGMFSANPAEVPDARLLNRLDYAEAQEIATTGAKVLLSLIHI